MCNLRPDSCCNTRAARGCPWRTVVWPACHFLVCTHLCGTLLRQYAGVFILGAVTPDGGLLFPHEGDIRRGGIGGARRRRATESTTVGAVRSAGCRRRGRRGIGEGAAGTSYDLPWGVLRGVLRGMHCAWWCVGCGRGGGSDGEDARGSRSCPRVTCL